MENWNGLSYISATCFDGSKLFININKVSLKDILDRIDRSPAIYAIEIKDHMKDETGRQLLCTISYIVGTAPECNLIDEKTGTTMNVRYREHPVIEFITSKQYQQTNLQ